MDFTPDATLIFLLRVIGGAGIVVMIIFLFRVFQPLGSEKLLTVSNRIILFAIVFFVFKLLSSILDITVDFAEGYMFTAFVNNIPQWFVVWYLYQKRKSFETIITEAKEKGVEPIAPAIDSIIAALQSVRPKS